MSYLFWYRSDCLIYFISHEIESEKQSNQRLIRKENLPLDEATYRHHIHMHAHVWTSNRKRRSRRRRRRNKETTTAMTNTKKKERRTTTIYPKCHNTETIECLLLILLFPSCHFFLFFLFSSSLSLTIFFSCLALSSSLSFSLSPFTTGHFAELTMRKFFTVRNHLYVAYTE